MTTFQHNQDPPFLSQLETHFQEKSANCPLKDPRKKAWDQFISYKLTKERHEALRYIKLKQLFANSYANSKKFDGNLSQKDVLHSTLFPESAKSTLVFVNGHFEPSLSLISGLSPRVVISPFQEALRTYSALMQNYTFKFFKEEKDPFALLNAALHDEGILIYLPPKTTVEAPIHLLNIVDSSTPIFLSPRVFLFAGAHTKVDLISSCQAVDPDLRYLYNQVIQIHQEENSHVTLSQPSLTVSNESWHFEAVRTTQKRNSTFKAVNCTQGSATIRYDYHVALQGENADTSLNGLWKLSNTRECHTFVHVDHQAPYCRSMQLFKGILNDAARSSFEGKIYVHQDAQKTEAFQLNNNLLLSNGAIANSKPNLEIFADDVKASHGATTGYLDEEQLFYLKTRGFAINEAKNILTHSFCQDLVNLFPVDSIKNTTQAWTKEPIT